MAYFISPRKQGGRVAYVGGGKSHTTWQAKCHRDASRGQASGQQPPQHYCQLKESWWSNGVRILLVSDPRLIPPGYVGIGGRV